MHIEDSYEGALRRLSRLSNAGFDLPAATRHDLVPSRREDEEARLRQRMRELEQLATLATDENERLERELAEARDTISRLQEQLTESDRRRLRELVEAAPPHTERRSFRAWWLALAAAGALAAATFTLRPWQYAPQAEASAQALLRRHVIHPWAASLDGVAVAPTPAAPPVVAPVAPVTPPVVAPVAPVTAAAPAKRVKHKRHRHASAKKPAQPRPAAKADSNADPLLGL